MKSCLKGCAAIAVCFVILVGWWLWRMVRSTDPLVSIVRVSDGRVVRSIRGHKDRITAVAYSPDGSLIASASWDGSVRLWSAGSGRCRGICGSLGKLNSLSFSPNGKLLAFGSDEHSMGIIRVSDARLVEVFRNSDPSRSVRFSPDGRFLACVADSGVELWDLTSGKLHKLKGNTEAVWTVAFSTDGKLLATRGFNPGKLKLHGYLNEIDLWAMSDFRRISTYTSHHDGNADSFDFSPDGRWLISAAGNVQLHQIRSDGRVSMDKVIPGHASQAALSPNGKLLVAAGYDPILYGFPGMKQLLRIHDSSTYSSCSVAFSPDGKYMAVGTSVRAH